MLSYQLLSYYTGLALWFPLIANVVAGDAKWLPL